MAVPPNLQNMPYNPVFGTRLMGQSGGGGGGEWHSNVQFDLIFEPY